METLKQKQAWSLDQKIFHFFEVIDKYYHHFEGKVYLSFSGGKDSTVLKFLLDKWLDMNGYPKIKYVFNDTTNEHKEILDFVKSFGEEITWLKPKMTFAQTLLKYGFPLISKEQSMAISRYQNTKSEDVKTYRLTGFRNGIKVGNAGVISKKWHFMINAPFKITNRCCDILKKQPIQCFEKLTGLKAIIGTMAEESSLRRRQYIKDGNCNVFTKGKEQCKPLSIFTEKDIWDLIKKFNIEICSIYYDQIINGELVTGEDRTGCAYCGFGCQFEKEDNNRFTRLSKREPKRYLSFMDKLEYRKALTFLGINLPD
jgi:3'-phosphoadenosine 5'-phosphosulfate sulfotransferase (PAPS reductase)/FAD synthetase